MTALTSNLIVKLRVLNLAHGADECIFGVVFQCAGCYGGTMRQIWFHSVCHLKMDLHLTLCLSLSYVYNIYIIYICTYIHIHICIYTCTDADVSVTLLAFATWKHQVTVTKAP